MTENEKQFIRTVVDYDVNINKLQNYLKENFDVESEYDPDNNYIKIYSEDNSTENLILAKTYINENNYLLDVIF